MREQITAQLQSLTLKGIMREYIHLGIAVAPDSLIMELYEQIKTSDDKMILILGDKVVFDIKCYMCGAAGK